MEIVPFKSRESFFFGSVYLLLPLPDDKRLCVCLSRLSVSSFSSICLFHYPCVCVCVCLSVSLSYFVLLFVCLFVSPSQTSVYLSFPHYLPASLSLSLCICFSHYAYLSVCVCTCVECLCICLSMSLYLSLTFHVL